jgi:hypothetical protein
MTTLLQPSITISSVETDSQFVNPAATVWLNSSHSTCDTGALLPDALETKQGSKTRVNHPFNQTCPHVGHKKKRRGSKIQRSQEAVTSERARYLERNRLAANRCRLKKKQESENIQRILDRETTKRDTLRAEVNKLREELWRLKNGIFAHARCGDHRINLQLTKMTQNILKSGSLQCLTLERPERMSMDLYTASPTSLKHDTVISAETLDCYIDLANI